MELASLKPKRHKETVGLPLPIKLKKDGTLKKIKGIFNGFSVAIEDVEHMENVITNGSFGKGNLSRSYPQMDTKSEMIRNRQFNYRKRFKNCSPKKVIVVPDSSHEEIEDYVSNIKPKYEIDMSGVKEIVYLTLEEAFFLVDKVECMDILYNSKEMDAESMWQEFCNINPLFIYHYSVYYHFRLKNWVVKTGIKFGCDYLLYKEGPLFYHAAYAVIIDRDDKLQEVQNPARTLDNTSIIALNRLCETAAKDLLICNVTLPVDTIGYRDISGTIVKETLVRRWNINKFC